MLFSRFKTFYIKPHERGILYYRGAFKDILSPGHHRRFGRHWTVQTYDLSQLEAQIDHLEFLVAEHSLLLNAYLTIVQTNFNEAALVHSGPHWVVVGPNQMRAFWKRWPQAGQGASSAPDVHRFNLDDGPELDAFFVPQLKDQVLKGLDPFIITESQIGLLYEADNFVRPLEPGHYRLWNFNGAFSIQIFDRTEPAPNFSYPDVLIHQHPEFVQHYCEAIQLGEQAVAIVRHRGKVIAILPPCSQKLFWQGVEVEIINLAESEKLSAPLVAELVSGLSETLELSLPYLYIQEVPSQHVGILYVEGVLQSPLPPGLHVWWQLGKSYRSDVLDLRLQTLEISGQEILSKDKVSLRINLTAGYRIVDPVQAIAGLADIEGFLYKELQFGLRAAVGTQRLDMLLENKESIDAIVGDYIRPKAEAHGIAIDSVGVKDIILPGDMKMILAQVVEAEKSAQANVIRRREETAATRSVLNTAKVMENNPVALRLKELEVLERIADRIEHIHVNGNLNSVLTDLIRIHPASE